MLRAALVLLVLTAIGHLPILHREVLYGTESFRIQVAYEMARSGDWLMPTLGGEPRITKPPLHYWMLAGVHQLFGWNFAMLRLPALLLTWLCGCVVWRVLARRCDSPTAWIGAVGTIWAPQVLWHGAMAEIDPGFAALTAMSVLLFVDAATTRRWSTLLFAGLLGGLAMLDKGPPYLMFLLGPLLLVTRRLGALRLLAFLILTFAPVAIWWVMLRSGSGLDTEALDRLVRNESVGRVAWFNWVSLLEAPGHLGKAVITVLPFSFWLHRLWRTREDDAAGDLLFRRALFASFLGMTLILLIYPRRPSRYMLPVVPLVAAAAAPLARAWLVELRPLPRSLRTTLQGVGLLAAITLPVLAWLPWPLPGRSFWLAAGIAALAPLMIRARPAAFAGLLVVPVLLIWTLRMDRERMVETGLRAEHASAALMRAELDESGPGPTAFWRDPGEHFALRVDPDLPWLLSQNAVPADYRFVIERVYDNADPDPRIEGFRPRARVRGRDRTWILHERVDER